MTCNIRPYIKDALELSGTAKEVNGELVLTRTTEEGMAFSMELGQRLEEGFGVFDLPFTVEGGTVQLNEPYLRHLEELNGEALPVEPDPSLQDDLLSSARRVADLWGISMEKVHSLKDSEGNTLEGVAAADLMNRSIQYLEDNEGDIPEEVAHFYVAALKERGEALYGSMRDRVFSEPEYQVVQTTHAGIGYSEEDMIDEAIAKVIVSRAKEPREDHNTRWWKRVLGRLREILNLSDPYTRAAVELFRSDMVRYTDTVSALKATTVFRSTGTPQTVLRDRLSEMHNSLMKEEYRKDDLKGKVGDWTFEVLSDGSGVMHRYSKDGKMIAHRATDRASLEFARKFRDLKDFLRIRSSKYAKSLRDSGTLMHEVMNDMIMAVATEDFSSKVNVMDVNGFGILSKEKVREKYSKLPKSALDEAELSSKETLKEMVSKLGAKGTQVDMYTEIRVVDDREDMAGTMDLLFVLPTGEAHIRDYKFIGSKFDERTKEGNRYYLTKDPFDGPKLLGYSEQMKFYAKVLREQLGARVATTRLIPGHIVTSWKGDVETLHTVSMSEDKWLRQIPVAEELYGTAEVQEMQKKLHAQAKELTSKSRMSPDDRRRLAVIRESLRNLLTLQDLSVTTDMVRDIAEKVDKGLRKGMSFDDMESAHRTLLLIHDLTDTLRSSGVQGSLKKGRLKRLMKEVAELEDVATRTSNLLQTQMLIDSQKETDIDLSSPAMPSTWASTFSHIGEEENPLFKRAHEMLSEVRSGVSMRMQALVHDWAARDTKLKEWAAAAGLSEEQAFGKLYRKTGTNLRMVSMYDADFLKERNSKLEIGTYSEDESERKEAIGWMKSRYRLKADAEALYKVVALKEFERLEKMYVGKPEALQKARERFIARNNVMKSDSAWVSKSGQRFLELVPEIEEKAYSAEYREIRTVPALLDYYMSWRDHMSMLEDLITEAGISPTTVPSVMSSIMEGFSKGKGLNALVENLSRGMTIDTDMQDEAGPSLRRIPLRYLHTPLSRKGEPEVDLLSTDLTRILLLFTESALTHHGMTGIESRLNFMRYMMTEAKTGRQQEAVVRNGMLERYEGSGKLKTVPVSEETVGRWDALIGMEVYNLRDSDQKLLGVPTPIWRKLMSLYSLSMLTLPIKAAIAAGVSSGIFQYAKTGEDANITSEAMGKMISLWKSDRKRYLQLSDAFDINQESFMDVTERRFRTSRLDRYFDTRHAYQPLIGMDRLGDRRLLITMLYNLGLSEEGEVKRLDELPAGTAPIAESVSFDEKGVINLSVKQYDNIRRRFYAEIGGVRGDSSFHRLYQAHTFQTMLMQFKTWAPAMARDRFGDLRYDRSADTMKEGKYSSAGKHLLNSLSTPEEDTEKLGTVAMLEHALRTMGRAGSVLLGINSFVLDRRERDRKKEEGKWSEADERNFQRRKALYEEELRVLKLNHVDPKVQSLSLDSYLQMKQGSVRATMVEVRSVLFMLLLTLLMGWKGDDDKEWYKESYTARKLYDILARINLESAVFLNPGELLKLNRSLVPMLGLVGTALQIVSNSADVMHDLVTTGKTTDKGDDTGLFWYSGGLIPGVRAMRYWTEGLEEE